MSSDIYEEFLYPKPVKDEFIKAMAASHGDWDGMIHKEQGRNAGLKSCNYFQMGGLRDFMESGIVHEFPPGFYQPLPPEVRKTMLQRIFVLIQEGNIIYRILTEKMEIPGNIYFYLGSSQMFFNLVTESGFKQIWVEEKGICSVFQQCMDYMEKKGLLLSPEDSLKMLEKFAKEYGIIGSRNLEPSD